MANFSSVNFRNASKFYGQFCMYFTLFYLNGGGGVKEGFISWGLPPYPPPPAPLTGTYANKLKLTFFNENKAKGNLIGCVKKMRSVKQGEGGY